LYQKDQQIFHEEVVVDLRGPNSQTRKISYPLAGYRGLVGETRTKSNFFHSGLETGISPTTLAS
jgi:hypothetical protein